MKLGISAFAWTARFEMPHLGLLPDLRKIGFDGVEVPMFDPANLPISNIRDGFEANELECTVCAILPKPFKPISPQPEMRKKAIEHLVRCIEASAAMRAKMIGGPLFAPIGYLPQHRPTKAEWSWSVEAFQSLEGRA